MAIDLAHWRMIVATGAKGLALSAGYPDLLVPKEEIQKALIEGDGEIRERHDSQELQAHHDFKGPIYDSRQVFKAIGLDLRVIDRELHEGCEAIVDLNEPWGDYEWDLVIDPGTSEHCFNIPQALVNLAGAVRVGGVISQALPMAMFNHGYWNVNPVALLDFYETNGFKVEKMVIRHPRGIFEPVGRSRYNAVPDGSVNIINARRIEKKPFTWPQQKNP